MMNLRQSSGIDAICNMLFQSNQDIYVELECVNNKLVYSPSLLDGAWLSEPERHDWKEKLQNPYIRIRSVAAFECNKYPSLLPQLLIGG